MPARAARMRSAGNSRFLSFFAFDFGNFGIGNFDDDGRVDWLVSFITDRCVDEQCVDILRLSISTVNVPEDVNLRLRTLNSVHQILITQMLVFRHVGERLIVDAHRWTVSNQYINSFWNQVPFSLDGVASIQIECPIEEGWLPRAAVNFQPSNFCHVVLKVNDLTLTVADNAVVEKLQRHRAILLEHPVMVSSNEDLVLVRQAAEPQPEGRNFVHAPKHRRVASVDQDVTVRNL